MMATIKNGKYVHLGYFDTESEAALARESYISEHPELGARTNFTQHIDT
jgi:hypothetical protein